MTCAEHDLRVTFPASGGFAVHVPHGYVAERVFQWHAERRVWRAGTGARDQAAEPACDQPCDGLTEQPADADDARRIVAAWLERQQ